MSARRQVWRLLWRWVVSMALVMPLVYLTIQVTDPGAGRVALLSFLGLLASLVAFVWEDQA